MIVCRTVSSPLGPLTLAAEDGALIGLWLENQRYFRAGVPQDAPMAPDAVPFPLSEMRARIGELDANKRYIILCGMGVRAYVAQCIMAQNGVTKAKIYPGGARFYQATHSKVSNPEIPVKKK